MSFILTNTIRMNKTTFKEAKPAYFIAIVLWSATLIYSAGCNHSSPQNTANNQQETSTQELINGKWQLDRASAEELKGMAMTIDNFALLNKKRFENSGAYQEFGLLLQNHLQRIDTYCELNADCRNTLYNRLNEIKAELPALSTGNLQDGKAALGRVKATWALVDSSFIYQ